MWIKPKNIRNMKPDEKTIGDYEDQMSYLRNLASGQKIVNAELQNKLREANETIDALRKEVTELVAKNYELSTFLAKMDGERR